VACVFQGHSHKNDYREIAGVHYVTLVAMVEGSGAESNGYATVDLGEDGSIQVHE
jgi:alkaline phosphatase